MKNKNSLLLIFLVISIVFLIFFFNGCTTNSNQGFTINSEPEFSQKTQIFIGERTTNSLRLRPESFPYSRGIISFFEKGDFLAAGFHEWAAFSEDGGETWEYFHYMSTVNQKTNIYGHIIFGFEAVYIDENIMAVGRDYNGALAISRDHGKTWSQYDPEELISSQYKFGSRVLDIQVLDGTLYAAYLSEGILIVDPDGSAKFEPITNLGDRYRIFFSEKMAYATDYKQILMRPIANIHEEWQKLSVSEGEIHDFLCGRQHFFWATDEGIYRYTEDQMLTEKLFSENIYRYPTVKFAEGRQSDDQAEFFTFGDIRVNSFSQIGSDAELAYHGSTANLLDPPILNGAGTGKDLKIFLLAVSTDDISSIGRFGTRLFSSKDIFVRPPYSPGISSKGMLPPGLNNYLMMRHNNIAVDKNRILLSSPTGLYLSTDYGKIFNYINLPPNTEDRVFNRYIAMDKKYCYVIAGQYIYQFNELNSPKKFSMADDSPLGFSKQNDQVFVIGTKGLYSLINKEYPVLETSHPDDRQAYFSMETKNYIFYSYDIKTSTRNLIEERFVDFYNIMNKEVFGSYRAYFYPKKTDEIDGLFVTDGSVAIDVEAILGEVYEQAGFNSNFVINEFFLGSEGLFVESNKNSRGLDWAYITRIDPKTGNILEVWNNKLDPLLPHTLVRGDDGPYLLSAGRFSEDGALGYRIVPWNDALDSWGKQSSYVKIPGPMDYSLFNRDFIVAGGILYGLYDTFLVKAVFDEY